MLLSNALRRGSRSVRRPILKSRMQQLMADPATRRVLRRFYRAMENYQASDYDKTGFREAYDALPEEVKLAIAHPKRGLEKLWRGSDSQQHGEPAISWTSSRGWARMFGSNIFPFTDLASFDAAIATDRVRALAENVDGLSDYEISDDEGEVIVLGARWKRRMTHDELKQQRWEPRRW